MNDNEIIGGITRHVNFTFLQQSLRVHQHQQLNPGGVEYSWNKLQKTQMCMHICTHTHNCNWVGCVWHFPQAHIYYSVTEHCSADKQFWELDHMLTLLRKWTVNSSFWVSEGVVKRVPSILGLQWVSLQLPGNSIVTTLTSLGLLHLFLPVTLS